MITFLPMLKERAWRSSGSRATSIERVGKGQAELAWDLSEYPWELEGKGSEKGPSWHWSWLLFRIKHTLSSKIVPRISNRCRTQWMPINNNKIKEGREIHVSLSSLSDFFTFYFIYLLFASPTPVSGPGAPKKRVKNLMRRHLPYGPGFFKLFLEPFVFQTSWPFFA